MNNEYTQPEVIEIGKAQEVILGGKSGFPPDDDLVARTITDNDPDE
jgi:hypothetical protein